MAGASHSGPAPGSLPYLYGSERGHQDHLLDRRTSIVDPPLDRDHRPPRARAAALGGAQAGVADAGRDGGIRHHAGDELPDARRILGALMAGGLRIAVLYEPSDNTGPPEIASE